MRIVLDTNVLVSGLLDPDGPPARVLDLILAGKLQILYDDRILAEHLDVLARPQFGFPPDLSKAVVGHFRLSGEHVTALPLPGGTVPDPGGIPCAEVAISGDADTLVTGNLRDFAGLESHSVRAISPDALLEFFHQG